MRLLLLLLCVLLLWPSASATARPLDWAVAGGHFYSQAAPDGLGFLVSDHGGVPFLSELNRRGGPEALGYPISHRFEWKGTTVQAFQKAVLQWLPGERRIAFVNVFDDLSQAGHDGWLRVVRSTPEQSWLPGEDRLSWEEVVRSRLAFLDTNPAIRARYRNAPDPLMLYGLPMSRVEDMGNHYAVRLQRAVIQQWKVDVPWARAGQTTVANGGDIAKEAGLFPPEALAAGTPDRAAAMPAPGPAVRPPSPQPTPSPAPTPLAVEPTPAPPSAGAAGVPPAGAARRVVLDAGHGGGQIGSIGRLPDGSTLREKDLNLDVVRRAAALLRAAGYEVIQTRDGDHQAAGPALPEDLQARIDIANRARADVFVSVHHNGVGDPGMRGLEVYFAPGRPFSEDSRALADQIYRQLGRHLTAAGHDVVLRGVRPDTAADGDHLFLLSPASAKVRRPSLMPAALGEALFLTNDRDAAALARPEVREAIARGYAVAIGTFLSGRRPWFS